MVDVVVSSGLLVAGVYAELSLMIIVKLFFDRERILPGDTWKVAAAIAVEMLARRIRALYIASALSSNYSREGTPFNEGMTAEISEGSL